MYTIDIGGTNLRIYKQGKLQYTQNFSGNINVNENFKDDLQKVISDFNFDDFVLIGIAGYYTTLQANKCEIKGLISTYINSFEIVSDVELHAKDLLNDNNLLITLGTGSVGCYYDNNEFKITGGFGHVLGDIGSGYHFGKLCLLSYLEDYEKNKSASYMKVLENRFGTSGRNLLSMSLNNEKTVLSQMSKEYMDDEMFNNIFELYFNEFKIELLRMKHVSKKDNILINGSICNSKKFCNAVSNLNMNIEIKNN